MRILALLAGAALALAACGGGDSPFDDEPTVTPTVRGISQTPVSAGATPTATACAQTVYEVKDGDVLVDIAERFGVSVDAIAEASNLPNADVLAIGEMLTIPCKEEDTGTPTGTAAPTATPGSG
jgi:LysM repeat protein